MLAAEYLRVQHEQGEQRTVLLPTTGQSVAPVGWGANIVTAPRTSYFCAYIVFSLLAVENVGFVVQRPSLPLRDGPP